MKEPKEKGTTTNETQKKKTQNIKTITENIKKVKEGT